MSFPTLTPHPVFRDMRGSGTLNPLPPSLQYGLIAVTMFGFLSTVSTIILLCALSWRIWTWKRQAYHANQFVFLIYFLILSDVQQALGFLLNAHWLMRNSIDVGTSTCWAQGCKYLPSISLIKGLQNYTDFTLQGFFLRATLAAACGPSLSAFTHLLPSFLALN